MNYRAVKSFAPKIAFGLVFVSVFAIAQQDPAPLDAKQQGLLKMADQIRKEIVMQPQYGVFDSIHFALKDNNTVVLRGDASRPTLKSGLENSIKKVEGVQSVDNRINVLPASPNDDRIRAAVYRSIYSFPSLQRYTSNRGGRMRPTIARAAGGVTNDPPTGYHAIHIIVQNGNVTLTGVVDSQSDAAVAGIRANSVPGVFSVDNNLQVASKS